jgi:hypothetical protein
MSVLATLGITAGSALLGSYLDRRAQDRAFEQNKEFWQERFDTEAKYNDPVQQMARLKKAGLNPAMMYGQSGSGATGNVSAPGAQGKVAERYELGALALQSAQVEKLQSDSNRVKAETEFIRAKTTGQGTTNEMLAKDLIMKELDAMKYPEQKKAQVMKIIDDARAAAAEATTKEKELELFQNVYEKAGKLGIDLRKGEMQVYFQALMNAGPSAAKRVYEFGKGQLQTFMDNNEYFK